MLKISIRELQIVIAVTALLLLGSGFLGYYLGGHNKYTKGEVDAAVAGAIQDRNNTIVPVSTADSMPPSKPYTSFSDGLYEIGIDIKPGTYKTDGGKDCYYARLSGFDTTNDIITNNITDGASTVTIKPTDKAFSTTRCGTWSLAN